MTTAPADDATAGLPLLAGWELLPASTPAQLGCFAVVYGLGYGATYTLVQSRAAQLFGTIDDFSRLQGFLVLWQYIGSFLGVVVTATLREAISFQQGEPTDPTVHPDIPAQGIPSTPRAGI